MTSPPPKQSKLNSPRGYTVLWPYNREEYGNCVFTFAVKFFHEQKLPPKVHQEDHLIVVVMWWSTKWTKDCRYISLWTFLWGGLLCYLAVFCSFLGLHCCWHKQAFFLFIVVAKCIICIYPHILFLSSHYVALFYWPINSCFIAPLNTFGTVNYDLAWVLTGFN